MKLADTAVSAVSPLRTVWIQRLHPWEWYGFGVVPPVCHPVPPCATLLTAVEEKEVLTQADTPDTA